MTQLSALIQGSGKTTIDKRSYVATAGQTAFAVNYYPPYVEVFQNGVRLNNLDYTASSGTSITLTVGAVLNDEIEIMGFASDASIATMYSGTTAPAVPVDGMTWYDTTDGSLYVRTGGVWAEASQAGATVGATGPVGPTGPTGPTGPVGATGAIPTLNILNNAVTNPEAVTNNHYVLTNTGAPNITMPTTPVAGDSIWITIANGLSTGIMYANGKKIMGSTENMVLDNANATYQMRYINDTIGWRIM